VCPHGRARNNVHPSSILRARDEEACHDAMGDFVRNLKAIAKLIKPR
jgi:hypothetical protein